MNLRSWVKPPVNTSMRMRRGVTIVVMVGISVATSSRGVVDQPRVRRSHSGHRRRKANRLLRVRCLLVSDRPKGSRFGRATRIAVRGVDSIRKAPGVAAVVAGVAVVAAGRAGIRALAISSRSAITTAATCVHRATMIGREVCLQTSGSRCPRTISLNKHRSRASHSNPRHRQRLPRRHR